MSSRFTRSEVQKGLREFDHAASDLLRSNHYTFDSNLKKFIHVLHTNKILAALVLDSLPDVDFETWYETAKKTVGGMVGSGELDWPVDKLVRLALQESLLEAIASGNENVLNFCMKFMYSDNNFDIMINDFNNQLVIQFARDARTFIEDVEFEPDRFEETAHPMQSIGELKKNIAFVMMSISQSIPELEDILSSIERACGSVSVKAERVDKIEHSGKITDLILEYLRTSEILICDISHERPNVYYELGYAHGFGKEVILLAKDGTTIHFDIKDYNTIMYRTYSELEKKLSSRLKTIVERPNHEELSPS